MKVTKDTKYKFIINKIKKISEILDTENPLEEDTHEAIVNFVSILEYIIKKKLYTKSKLLIYDFNSSDIDIIKAILEDKIKTRNTVTALDALSRYKKFYPKSKLNKQAEGIEILIRDRNELVHNINIKNVQKKEDLIGILSTVFPIFLNEASKVLGPLPNTKVKREKVYTEKDIQKIYEDIVLSKINNHTPDLVINHDPFIGLSQNDPRLINDVFADKLKYSQIQLSPLTFGNEFCPRCSNYTLTQKNDNRLIFSFASTIASNNHPDLYICSKCNLELTSAEYETVQKLKKEGKINTKWFQ